MKHLKKHLQKIMDESPGTQYYKVDLHIHTASSVDAQGSNKYGYSKKDAKADRADNYTKARKIADQIVEKLVDDGIQVAAFTDHNSPGFLDNADFSSPTWFQLVEEAYQERQAKDPDCPPLLLLPGVEITTDRIHVLGIFDNNDPHIIFKIASLLRSVDVREHEFGEVDGTFGTKSIWEVADAIHEMGGICIPAHINARSARSLLRQYEPPDMEIVRLVQHQAIHVFGVVPTSSSWRDERTYQSILENKTFKRRGGAKVRYHDWMVEQRSLVPQHLPALGYMMNSDAHSVAKIGERFSWVRLDDLTFRSLAASLRNPFYTIAPSRIEPVSPVRSQVLGLSFEGGFADGLVMRFNEHFNCVVGLPASGKTTIMRTISDTFWGRRLGLRIRDDTRRAIEHLARGLWDEMLLREGVFTKAGSLRKNLPKDVQTSFEGRFPETHGLPWAFYLFFAQVEPDGRKTIYAAERLRPPGGVDAEGKEDKFRYYRSQPLPADLTNPGQIEFSEIEASEFRRSMARPTLRFGRIGLGQPEDDYQAARTLLDLHLLRVMEGYDEHRRSLWDLCTELNTAATQEPPDTGTIKYLAIQARQHLEALFKLRKEFAKSFNATEQEHTLRIGFRKGRWQKVAAAVPAPGDVQDFTHNIRLCLHGQEFYDYLDLTFFRAKKRGKGWDEIPYEDLTPGQRSLMALRLLLNSSRDMAPVFIDTPERWLDNESLLEFYDLRRIRQDQLILFTQNPNIAVLGNAEKITILKREQDRTSALCAGGLDDEEVAKQIIRLLEGGRIAFERKLLRYNAELAEDGLRIALQRV
jgi:predicted metal-dependent phosphoesterase TrpH